MNRNDSFDILTPTGHIKSYPLAAAGKYGIVIKIEDTEGRALTWTLSPMAKRRGYKMYIDTCIDRTTTDGEVINEYQVYQQWKRQVEARPDKMRSSFPLELHSQEARNRRAKRAPKRAAVSLPTLVSEDEKASVKKVAVKKAPAKKAASKVDNA